MLRFVAYIDLGTGSFILQAAVGTVMGVSFVVRNRVKDLVARFKKSPETSKPEKG